ncbi:Scr1 family TA system antitoxin-like transcriptional regulator [Saccharothrix coeruleofusca]|uniref:HTH cro/C1-type domain-containing protein n=1 Tax=Saccharothrix coeruleofusca TaxID=33919 RepID=A0A918EGZ6_9PSEU|nr:Scr1 family TA system antitoxin-like transcriptional regulator [Saccharothrix coeruleofusca]GGP77327.1 hypothetical protein GCM10010185_58740 [Saccharothrix coeruleofusca]
MTHFREFVTAEYSRGRTIRALAAMTGRSYGTVRSALVSEGVELRSRGARAARVNLGEGDAGARREELSVLLLSSRLNAGLTGRDAGARAGMSQSKLSKLETGRLVPKVDDVARLAENYAVSPEIRGRMVELASLVSRDARHRRAVLHRGAARQQVRVARAEQSATTVRVLGVGGLPEAVLDKPPRGKEFVVLMPEGVVRSAPDLVQQVYRVSMAEGIEVGIIPFFSKASIPDAGYRVLDERMVVVELLAGNVVITDPEDVAEHVAQFEQLREHAVFGDRMRYLFL